MSGSRCLRESESVAVSCAICRQVALSGCSVMDSSDDGDCTDDLVFFILGSYTRLDCTDELVVFILGS